MVSRVRVDAGGQDSELAAALVTVFLTPSSLKVLEERLRRRGQDSEETMVRRLGVAREEIERWPAFDYLVVSWSIPEDLRRMQTIVDAEKMRSRRISGPVCE